MADHKNRGGQKKGNQNPDRAEQSQGTNSSGSGQREDKDKRQDQQNNPDNARREPTSQKD